VEACPTEAITETKLFEFSFTNRRDAIYTKAELVVDDDGRAKRMPWEHWEGHEDDRTSAWMRATAPAGNASYEGRVAWAGELGVGVREPELGQTAPAWTPPAPKAAAGHGHGASGGGAPGHDFDHDHGAHGHDDGHPDDEHGDGHDHDHGGH
jgi:NADH-quinone oxidoreductase subunit I